MALCGAESWALRRVDKKDLENFEKRCWIERVTNEEVLHRVKEQRNVLHTVTRRKGNWIGHSRRRNCILIHVIGGKVERRIEVTG